MSMPMGSQPRLPLPVQRAWAPPLGLKSPTSASPSACHSPGRLATAPCPTASRWSAGAIPAGLGMHSQSAVPAPGGPLPGRPLASSAPAFRMPAHGQASPTTASYGQASPTTASCAFQSVSTSPFQIGEQVEAQWGRHGGDSWFPAVIASRNADGTFMVEWQDGNTHGRRKRAEEIRKLGSRGTEVGDSSTHAGSMVGSPSSSTAFFTPSSTTVHRTSSSREYHGAASPLDPLERSQPSSFFMGPSSPRTLNAGMCVDIGSTRNLNTGMSLDVETSSSVSTVAEPVLSTRPTCVQSPQSSTSGQGHRRLSQQNDIVSPPHNPPQQAQPPPPTQKQHHVLSDSVPVETTPRTPPQPRVCYETQQACEASAEVPAEALAEDQEGDSDRPKPRDDVRCFVVELENGEKGVVVQSNEGKRWRFQQSSIDFELAADATTLKDWLAGIKDQQFPGLLTLLAGEVTERGGELKSMEKDRDALRGTEDYDFFGLDGAECTDKDVERAYRKKSMQLHPDKGGDEAAFDDMRKKFEQIMELRGESKRKEGSGAIKWDPNSRESMMQAHGDLREQLIWITKHIEEVEKEVAKLRQRQLQRRTLTDG